MNRTFTVVGGVPSKVITLGSKGLHDAPKRLVLVIPGADPYRVPQYLRHIPIVDLSLRYCSRLSHSDLAQHLCEVRNVVFEVMDHPVHAMQGCQLWDCGHLS